jgi:uncharacterized protein YerC
MFDDKELPDQFPNPRDTLPAFAQQWWDSFANGGQPNTAVLQQVPMYCSTWELFCEITGRNASGTAVAFSELKKAERNYYAAVRAQYPNQYRVPQTDYNGMVRDALNFYQDGEKRSASGVVRGYVPEEHARAVANRKGQRKRMRRAIEANKAHPAHTAITSRIGKQGTNSMAQDTVSMTLVRLMMEAGTQRTLDTMSNDMAELKARVAALEAVQAATEKRHAIEDAGQTPEQRVIELRKQGLGYKAIQSATGISQSTVRNWVKAHGL